MPTLLTPPGVAPACTGWETLLIYLEATMVSPCNLARWPSRPGRDKGPLLLPSGMAHDLATLEVPWIQCSTSLVFNYTWAPTHNVGSRVLSLYRPAIVR